MANDDELLETVRKAKAAQDAELIALSEIMPILLRVENRYGAAGSRRGNTIATRAHRARFAIAEIIDEVQR